jgi:hypothetical protein
VSLSEKASRVQVHSQGSTLLDSCKRIGPVSGAASSVLSPKVAAQEAYVKIRENAADMGGDTVAILNTDNLLSFTTAETSIQGIAFKCF